jgi:transcriptional regulator GlxA family with amidase domain
MSGSSPLHYVLAIFPGFQLLDLAGPLDILNLLSGVKTETPLTLTILAETLDPVPCKPIVPANANWTYDLSAAFPQSNGKINTSFNQYLLPDTTFDEYIKSVEGGKLDSGEGQTRSSRSCDVLLIPGGVGTRLTRVLADGTKESNILPLLNFIPRLAPHISTAIVTVCTGSDALAQTGLLRDRRATTNMAMFSQVKARTPSVKWQDMARWVRSLPSESEEEKGANFEIWTSAGISAGMDVTLAFVAHHYGGLELARDLAKRLEYDWREIPEAEKDPLYEKHWSG